MPDDVMLQEAVDAVRRGQRNRARDLLTRLLRSDQTNPQYWLWMSAVVDSRKERVYCLQSVLRLDPGNPAARHGLVLAGALPPDDSREPAVPVRRKWEVAVEEPPRRGLAKVWGNPVARILILVGTGALVLGMVLAGIFGLGRGRRAVAMRPTKTPGPPPTFTATPTFIGGPRQAATTPVPASFGPAPLWMALEATYTPTPAYVSTPHAISEAFRAGQRAYAQGDWQKALDYFEQAAQVDLTAFDIPYHIGETLYQMGQYQQALEAYEKSLEVGPDFAPAYLGRARASLAAAPMLSENPAVERDFQQAVELDPNFGEIYLERAAYWLQVGDLEAAEADLEAGETLLPTSPLLPLYRAQIALMQGEGEQSLELAQQAYDQDQTLLPAYLTLGQASLVNGRLEPARKTLEIYVQYSDDDPAGWLALGQAQSGLNRPDQAYSDLEKTAAGKASGEDDPLPGVEAFDRVLELDETSAAAYFYRGLAYLAGGKGQEAVNDLYQARKLMAESGRSAPGEPLWFEINLGMGRALQLADRLDDALGQINTSLGLAESDLQRGAVYFWRAQLQERIGDDRAAYSDWQALLGLPKDDVLISWTRAARAAAARLATPTPTATPSPTITSTVTPRTTSTVSPTAPKKPSPSPTVRISRTPTPVVLKTPTP